MRVVDEIRAAVRRGRRAWSEPDRPVEHGGDPAGRIVVAFANAHFNMSLGLAAIEGPPGVRFTNDRREIPRADAVVFHVPTSSWLPRRKPAGQLWVAWSLESVVNYPELADPRFLARFDLRMTYELGSDVPLPYVRPYLAELVDKPVRSHEPDGRRELVASFVSSRVDRSGRNALHGEVARRLPLHAYGKVGRNRVLREDRGLATKLEVLSRYRFTLALENSIAEDYVTEKLYDPLVAGSLPVYLGAPNAASFAPGDHCFVPVSDFRGPAELAKYLEHLATDEAEYLEYHAWRSRPLRPEFLALVEGAREHPFVRLGRLVAKRVRPSPPRDAERGCCP